MLGCMPLCGSRLLRAALGGVCWLLAWPVAAQTPGTPASPQPAVSELSPLPKLGTTTPLWPSGAPGALGTGPDDVPTLTAYLPADNPTHAAIVIAPGGGYGHLSTQLEGEDVALWLNQNGIAAFVLRYRLGPRYRHPVELGDATRAMRVVRATAASHGLAPDRIGLMGFSAGGHLAASVGTGFDAGQPSATDAIERVSSRPDFLILAYPVISMEIVGRRSVSRANLLGDAPDTELKRRTSAHYHVTAQTPPTFLFATSDDTLVPSLNSVLFYSALRAAGVPAELHLFEHGPHGAALAQNHPALKSWPRLLLDWLATRELVRVPAGAAPPAGKSP
jgi:acetyl esterase/lipase